MGAETIAGESARTCGVESGGVTRKESGGCGHKEAEEDDATADAEAREKGDEEEDNDDDNWSLLLLQPARNGRTSRAVGEGMCTGCSAPREALLCE